MSTEEFRRVQDVQEEVNTSFDTVCPVSILAHHNEIDLQTRWIPLTASLPPIQDCVIIRHARGGGHPGRLNYSIKLQLDSGFRRNDGSFPQLRHSL
jgi:hypothetical protein